MTSTGRAFASDNPLRTREDWQRALLHIVAPLDRADDTDAFSSPGTTYSSTVARLESFARPLWGLAALAAGGGTHAGWPRIRQALIFGTDPDHPDFWGMPSDLDQRLVEAAAIGFALALAPGELWEPLSTCQRTRLAQWLRSAAAARRMPDNNWRLFAVLVNLGLETVGEQYDTAVTDAAFARVETFYRGDGWYSDGPEGQPCDYYGAWALHFYSLLYTSLAKGADADAVARIRARAERFAQEFRHWFADDGAALPYGRSLTYRFAQSCFWGALAFADLPALPWGQVRGLWARNLRWWSAQPVLNGDGTLSVGYVYPNLLMSDQYNAPGSPYWACKAFLPLALPADHPFWTAEEEPATASPAVHPQPTAGLLLQRDPSGHVHALSAFSTNTYLRHGEAKYGKFAYSTAFGFSVPSRARTLEGAGSDSALAVSEDGLHWRVREECTRITVDERCVHASWRPYPDVDVETWLIPAESWHVRIHRITSARTLYLADSGYCVPREPEGTDTTADGAALACGDGLASGVRDLLGGRSRAEIVLPDPNSHLMWPRTALPTLRTEISPGEHWLATGVYGSHAAGLQGWHNPPALGSLTGLPPGLPVG